MAEPTLEQLENTAMALGLPVMPEALRPDHYEESLRNLHRIAQAAILGDEEAGRKLTALKAAFGKPEKARS